jgi:4'-phosphopantetheinyl transferase EntD
MIGKGLQAEFTRKLQRPPSEPPRPPSLASSTVRAMFGPDVAVATASPHMGGDALFPDEQSYIAGACERRRAEFGTARLCARRALAELGVAPCALVPGPDRSPRWPENIRGTIAHSRHACAAALTKAPHILGIGLDLEEDTPLEPDLEAMICTTTERSWLDPFSPPERGLLGKVIFCAKEAFYKCQYPISRTFLDFSEVTLSIDLAQGTFRIADLSRAGAPWDRLRDVTGQFRRQNGLVIATAMLASPALSRKDRSGHGALPSQPTE